LRLLKEWIHLLFKNNKIPGTVLFRVDAGRTYGLSFGHVSRCLVLARVLQSEYGSEIMFLMRNFPEGINHVTRNGYRVQKLSVPPDREERESIMDAINEYQPDMLIIDVPYKDIDTSYYGILRERGINMVFIDDSRFIHPDVDVLLNSSILASQRMQKINKGKHVNTRYLLGIDYFIFDEYLKKEDMVRGQNETYNILVTFGGSDPTSLTMKVLKTLLEEDLPGYAFSIILGPGYPDTNKIETLIGGSRNRFTVIINPENLIPLLQHCDLAICAGGRTMYELLYFNKKFFPVASAEHESEVVEEFIRLGIIKDGLTSWDPKTFISGFKYLTKQVFDNVNENSINR